MPTGMLMEAIMQSAVFSVAACSENKSALMLFHACSI